MSKISNKYTANICFDELYEKYGRAFNNIYNAYHITQVFLVLIPLHISKTLAEMSIGSMTYVRYDYAIIYG